MVEQRRPATIDFGMLDDRDVRRNRAPEQAVTRTAIADAKEAGFTSRAETVPVDGRTLRRTGRSAQLNVKLRPQTKEAFLKASSAFGNTEDFVIYLLGLLNRQ